MEINNKKCKNLFNISIANRNRQNTYITFINLVK